ICRETGERSRRPALEFRKETGHRSAGSGSLPAESRRHCADHRTALRHLRRYRNREGFNSLLCTSSLHRQMNRAGTIALAPLGVLYGAAMRARRAMYQRGLFQTQHLGVPVISVGNITTGGNGKTPLVEWIAAETANHQRRV